MSQASVHREMILEVANAIGEDLIERVVFVGGCTTALLLTDDFSLEQVRHTDDVDLIVHIASYAEWADLQSVLKRKGFKEVISDDPICALKLGALRVDFMPDNEGILGFSNRWYAAALSEAEYFNLTDEVKIRLIQPQHFIATKLEAYLGRGNNDALGSRDIEDILALVDGRDSLIEEMRASNDELRNYVSHELGKLLKDRNFEFAVGSAARGDGGREELIFERLAELIGGRP